MRRLALDISVAVPYLMRGHSAHVHVRQWLAGVETVLTTHSLVETYSVLTRLPGDARVAPVDAVRLIDDNMGAVVAVPEAAAMVLHQRMARHGVAGGAVHDALVGIAASAAALTLVTRDVRAAGTYTALEVDHVLLVDPI